MTDITDERCIFRELFNKGVQSFGAYRNGVHIDTRGSTGMHTFDGQQYALWGKHVPGQLLSELPETCNQ